MKKVLVVDDSASVRLEVGRALEAAGYGVIEAGDGMDGLEKAAQGELAMVLVDVNMPRMGGLEMLEKLRAAPATRDVPVLFLTTEVQQSMIDRARGAGATGWVYKPPNLALLVKTVNQLLR